MTQLTDIQLVLLSNAAQREDGTLLPAPESLSRRSAAVTKSITALIRRGLAEETEATGAALTTAGRTAIGIDLSEPAVNETAAPSPAATQPPRQTKAAVVLAMLERDEGATLDELIAATNWLPHTMRAALTGLRKKGHAIDRSKRGDMTCYYAKAA
nr:DUF3489 domain-containing protein [Sphingomonas sp. CDS-1]